MPSFIRSIAIVEVALVSLGVALPDVASATSDCTEFTLLATQPPDGTVVPRRAVFRAFYDAGDCAPQVSLRLTCDGRPVPLETERDRFEGLVEGSAADELPEGARCLLEVEGDDDVVADSVELVVGTDEATPPPTAPRLVDAVLENPGADGAGRVSHGGTVTLEVDADPLGMSIVQVIQPASGHVNALAPAPAAGGTVQLTVSRLYGDDVAEACFRVETLDAVGQAAAADVCAPSTEVIEEEGCAAAGDRSDPAPLLLAMAALAAAARRGRRRRVG